MAEKILNTRILLKTDTLENWSYYPYTTGKAYNSFSK